MFFTYMTLYLFCILKKMPHKISAFQSRSLFFKINTATTNMNLPICHNRLIRVPDEPRTHDTLMCTLDPGVIINYVLVITLDRAC